MKTSLHHEIRGECETKVKHEKKTLQSLGKISSHGVKNQTQAPMKKFEDMGNGNFKASSRGMKIVHFSLFSFTQNKVC